MKAFRLIEWQRPPRLVDVEVPEPGPGQVLIRVGGAGACHSDIHVMEWPAGTLPYGVPFTLGHENAGWVERVGPGVDRFAAGDPVAVYGPWGCGACPSCIRGMDNVCELWRQPGRARGGGLGRDGGMAELMLVPEQRFLVPLRDLPPAAAAPLTDAGLTPYHAIKGSLHVLAPDVSGTIAQDGTLTMITTGTPRGSGVVLTETFNLTRTSASTLSGSVTGTLGLGTTVRGMFSGSVLSGTR